MIVSRGNTKNVSEELRRLKKTMRLWFPVEKQIGDKFPLT